MTHYAAGFGTDEQLLSNNGLRRAGVFSDVTLKVGDRQFPCSRIMLITSCTYFEALFLEHFTEPEETEVELSVINADDFDLLLDYIYGGSVNLNQGSIAHRLLSASHRVGYKRPNDLFAYFLVSLQSIPLGTVVRMYKFMENTGEERFTMGLAKHVAQNFRFADEAVCNELLRLSENQLLKIFENEAYKMRPADTLQFLVRWSKFQPENDEELLLQMVEHVRFSEISQTTLGRIFAQCLSAISSCQTQAEVGQFGGDNDAPATQY